MCVLSKSYIIPTCTKTLSLELLLLKHSLFVKMFFKEFKYHLAKNVVDVYLLKVYLFID